MANHSFYLVLQDKLEISPSALYSSKGSVISGLISDKSQIKA